MNQECYFDDPNLLARVPGLLLTLAAIYFVMGLTGALLIIQPPEDWLTRLALRRREEEEATSNGSPVRPAPAAVPDDVSMSSSSAATNLESETDVRGGGSGPPDRAQAPIFVSWKKAFRRKELYLLWVTRLSVVLITQVSLTMLLGMYIWAVSGMGTYLSKVLTSPYNAENDHVKGEDYINTKHA